jgi:hypothetical protein
MAEKYWWEGSREGKIRFCSIKADAQVKPQVIAVFVAKRWRHIALRAQKPLRPAPSGIGAFSTNTVALAKSDRNSI